MKHFIRSLQSLGKNSDAGGAGAGTAIIMGSDAWDLLVAPHYDPDFADHLQACTTIVETARKLYPNATVVWKYV
jgi:hypothetical protein